MMLPASKEPILGHFDLVKRLNYAVVYRVLDKEGAISRIQLSKTSQLAPASITKIIRSFQGVGLIKEIEQQASTGGRRPVSLKLATEDFHVIGVRLGRDHLNIGLYDLSATLLASSSHDISYEDQRALELLLIEKLKSFIQAHKTEIRHQIAISVTLPGIMTDVVYYLPHLQVNQWDLVNTLSQEFGCKVYIGHHIRSLALAEHYFGSTQETHDSVFISIHNGVGAGIIINGEILLGQKGNLGEIGHIQIDPLGPKCHCGQFGCLETLVSNTRIKEKVERLLAEGISSLVQPGMDIKQLSELANAKDQLAMNVIQEVGEKLGKVIAILINLLNPQKIVITGKIADNNTILLSSISKVLEKECLTNFNQTTQLGVASLAHDSTLGAFALVKQRLLNGDLLSQIVEPYRVD